jgi:dUTP pyrophosphatase
MDRKFEKVKKYQDINLEYPTRQTINSAGYDFVCAEDTIIKAKQIVRVSTGMKAYLLDDEVLILALRSSLPKNYSLMLINGVGIIDSDYVDNINNEGEISAQLYNFSDNDVEIKRGERIVQGIIIKYLKTNPDNVKNNLRVGGYGSSNNK